MTALQLNAELYRAMGENRETEVSHGFRFFVSWFCRPLYNAATFFSSFVIARLMKSGMIRIRYLSYRSHLLLQTRGTSGQRRYKDNKHPKRKENEKMARWCSRCLS